eukprot:gene7700-10379_t
MFSGTGTEGKLATYSAMQGVDLYPKDDGRFEGEEVDVLKLMAAHYRKLPRWMTKMAESNQLATVSTTHRKCILGNGGPLGPVIIGGIGDSGTRGMAGLVEQAFDYNMCPYPHKCNKASDNSTPHRFGKKILEDNGWVTLQGTYHSLQ